MTYQSSDYKMAQTAQNVEPQEVPVARLGVERLARQGSLDREKTQSDRNRMGQFATPPALAGEILAYAASLMPDGPVRFLDPAIGTGAFYEALLKVFPSQRMAAARGFELDPHYGKPASELWKSTGLDLKLADFTKEDVNGRTANLVICNPPYVRHHHLESADKGALVRRSLESSGIKLSGLAGLYCHFLLLAHRWLEPGALAGWLVPSEFMDVNYGRAVKRYLLERVSLLHIHRFDPEDVQFADALVSSAVVWFQNSSPSEDHSVLFSFGGSLSDPHLGRSIRTVDLAHESKWTRFPKAGIRRRSSVPVLSDFFRIKRGIATGNNSYFILDADEIKQRNLPLECLRPILPSPRYLESDEVLADGAGMPKLERRLYLLDPPYPEEEIQERFPPGACQRL